MSHFLDRLTFFNRVVDNFSDGHGIVTNEDRRWEDGYRKRWQHDKIVRSTHGANCTGSCSWKIYVKGGIVTWETQQTDYPRTRPELPNHEPRGCSRGASYSWYLYSGNRVKYPLVRSRLLKLWREARSLRKPVAAWESIVTDPKKRAAYTEKRGLGGFVRATWDEVTEIIAAANAYTVKKHGPDRVIGFSPIPAMSMVSYAAGSRYLSLLGGVSMSFYDWYCDLPPSSPQTWGEQTDVPESADWYNSGFLILWGSNVPQTRTPDAHFYTEARYRGAKSVVICPDYSEASKFSDLWISVKQGTDSALAMAMGHVILREFYFDKQTPYFEDYIRQYTDMPMLVRLVKKGDSYIADRQLRASDFADNLGETNNPEWKTVAFDETSKRIVAPTGSVGFRWGEKGKWNLEEKDANGSATKLRLTFANDKDELADVGFPYFGNREHDYFAGTDHPGVLVRKVPAKRVKLKDGEALVASVFDLFAANYGLDRGFGGKHVAKSYDDNEPYTPAWAEKISGVPRDQIITVAREFALNAEKTKGRSMIIIGAAMNHWFHCDMNYRGAINMLVLCGCVGQSGGGWSHYVGPGKAAAAIGLAAARLRPRLGAATAPAELHLVLLCAHRSMALRDRRHRRADFADRARRYLGRRADRLQCAGRAHGLVAVGAAAAAELARSRQEGASRRPRAQGLCAEGAQIRRIADGLRGPGSSRQLAAQHVVWRSNILGSSGKGHEYFLKHLLGTNHGVQGKDLGQTGKVKPKEVVWHEQGPQGKLDLLVTLDFRMSTTCVYSDIVLPTATWYEKNDLNTSDMHPFIHPLTAAVDPVWECKSDWEIYKAIAKKFSEVAPEVLGVEKDVVMTPIMHDTPGEIAQALDVKDWKKGECEPVPGKTMPNVTVVERDYPNLYKRYTSLGPLMSKLGNGGKGMSWNTEHEVELLQKLNGVVTEEGTTKGLARISSDIDATEVILSLAPETNGEVAVKAWASLGGFTGREHTHLAVPKEDEKIRFRDVVAQPRKIISSPIWSGLESEKVCYNASYTNVHELIPWRTFSRPSAALSGPSVDAGFRRGALRLSAAGRSQDDQTDHRPEAERREADRAEFHHAAPEMGHPFDLYRQSVDAHAVAWRADRMDQRERRHQGRHRR